VKRNYEKKKIGLSQKKSERGGQKGWGGGNKKLQAVEVSDMPKNRGQKKLKKPKIFHCKKTGDGKGSQNCRGDSTEGVKGELTKKKKVGGRIQENKREKGFRRQNQERGLNYLKGAEAHDRSVIRGVPGGTWGKGRGRVEKGRAKEKRQGTSLEGKVGDRQK